MGCCSVEAGRFTGTTVLKRAVMTMLLFVAVPTTTALTP
jgi:hypothetical protein